MKKTLSPMKQLLAAFAAYVVLLALSLIAARLVPQFRFAIMLVPLVPGFLIVLAMVAALRSMDEMQRRIQFEALGFAYAGMFMLLVTESLLGVIVPQQLQGPFAYIGYMSTLWLIGLLVSQRKYR